MRQSYYQAVAGVLESGWQYLNYIIQMILPLWLQLRVCPKAGQPSLIFQLNH